MAKSWREWLEIATEHMYLETQTRGWRRLYHRLCAWYAQWRAD